MPDPNPSPIESRPGAGAFASTQWSVILRAGEGSSPDAGEALEALCRTYWPPLYAYVRRRGHAVHEAQDLVQEFLSRLLGQGGLHGVDREKGRFRSFLLASMNHFLTNEWHRGQRQKRGGGRIHLSLDQALEEGVADVEPVTQFTPEKAFERRWAETVLRSALERLRSEWGERYQARHFDDLKGFLLEPRGAVPLAEVASRLGITEPALKSIVHRLRKRYGELFRQEVARTVGDPAEVEEEIRQLLAALSE
ncbi:MAG TPA: RNA polymerase subunit sigma-24 [Verrucomicrobiales bacterium]|nr:RNA polymerase subunit sigma-24 [Verrucomicrobiales bacterium]